MIPFYLLLYVKGQYGLLFGSCNLLTQLHLPCEIAIPCEGIHLPFAQRFHRIHLDFQGLNSLFAKSNFLG